MSTSQLERFGTERMIGLLKVITNGSMSMWQRVSSRAFQGFVRVTAKMLYSFNVLINDIHKGIDGMLVKLANDKNL